jgi:hypothetical protein
MNKKKKRKRNNFKPNRDDVMFIEMKGITRCNLGLVRVGNFWKC